MTVKQALRKARALIVKGWTQGTSARDRLGKPVEYNSSRAAQFCSVGALQRVCPAWETRQLAFAAICKVSRQLSVVDWNDSERRKKPQVIRAFDRAIKAAP